MDNFAKIWNMDKIRRIITTRLKSAREEKGFTQNEVAEYLGMERASYTQIESGRNMISVENLIKASEILEKPINYFLDMGCDDLENDEVEILAIYRALPDRHSKENALRFLRGWLKEVS